MDSDKTVRLENILEKIKSINVPFEELLMLLKNEYRLESAGVYTHQSLSYGWHLNETLYLAKEYEDCTRKNKYKGCIDEYNTFLRAFEGDIQRELMKIRSEI